MALSLLVLVTGGTLEYPVVYSPPTPVEGYHHRQVTGVLVRLCSENIIFCVLFDQYSVIKRTVFMHF